MGDLLFYQRELTPPRWGRVTIALATTVAYIWRERGRPIIVPACDACVGSWTVIHKSRSSCRRRLCHFVSASFRTPRYCGKPPRPNALQPLDPIWKDIQHRRIDLLVRALLTDAAPPRADHKVRYGNISYIAKRCDSPPRITNWGYVNIT